MEKQAAIFDFGRTLFDPVKKELFPNTFEVLEFTKGKGLGVGLVSITLTDRVGERMEELDRLGLTPFFDEIELVPRSQASKDFISIIRKLGVLPVNALVVGDNLKREIAAGNRIGAFTVWTKERLLADFKPQNELQVPKATINQIKELIPLVEQLI